MSEKIFVAIGKILRSIVMVWFLPIFLCTQLVLDCPGLTWDWPIRWLLK
jgi:hypothetical protein